MPAGTITLTNNSTTVTGTGTSFTTELKVNDFVMAVVGGVAYTLGVAAIASNTSLTLIQKYDGPTTSGLSWNPVPYGTMAAITAQLAAQVTYAIRGLNLDKNNWQQIFTGTGNVTVNLPDGTSWTGPAWNGISSAISGKADLVSGAVAVSQGGTGAKTKADAWAALATFGTAAGTAAQGNDNRLGTLDGKTGGVVSSGTTFDGSMQSRRTVTSETSQSSNQIFVTLFTGTTERARMGFFVGVSAVGERVGQLQVGQDGTNKTWLFNYGTGSASAPGQWINGSDENFKTNITAIEDPLIKMRMITGCTWERLDFDAKGIGFIAQDVQKVFPDSVYINDIPTTLKDGTVLKSTLSLDTSGVAAALHHQAILALMDKVEALERDVQSRDAAIEEIQKRLKALDGLDA